MKKEKYLKDRQFLKELDNENIKTLIARVTILNWLEEPIMDFTGRVLPGGVVNLDGNSSLRRTCNISLFLDDNEIDITRVENLISINKKIKLEIGVYNTLDKYQDYEIIWFPLGIYVIIQPNISRSTSGTTVALQLKDKMCLLNGEVAGTLPASITFNEMGFTDEDGNEFIENPTLFQIILELVNHWGGEQLGNIIISDLDTRIKKVMKWNSANYPVYYKEMLDSNNHPSYSYKTQIEFNNLSSHEQESYQEHGYGEDIGFIYTDFIWPSDDLIGDIGSTVCDILDKISSLLGNFEYFYDIYGKFHFREKKNYLNTTQATTFLRQLERQQQPGENNYLSLITKEDYQIDLTNGKSEYKFDNNNLILSYTNTPQFSMIKNDFLVWGLRKTTDGTTLPIRYHLAIDKKPEIGQSHLVVVHLDDNGYTRASGVEFRRSIQDTSDWKLGHYYCITKTSKVIIIDELERMKYVYGGNYGIVYVDLDGINATLYKYDWVVDKTDPTKKSKQPILVDQIPNKLYLAYVTPSDWRTELYLQGVTAEANGVEANHYYTELSNEWPKLYDIIEGKFRDEVLKDPGCMDYFLDFIDADSAIGEFCINNIGRRTYAITDDKINCIFSIDPVDCIILAPGESNEEAIDRDQKYSSVSDDLYKNLIQGGNQNSAYSRIRELLYQYTSYCESITLQSIPIYHLDVNTRVTVNDPKSNIFGDYFINRISLPLDCNGTMNINATRALERI